MALLRRPSGHAGWCLPPLPQMAHSSSSPALDISSSGSPASLRAAAAAAAAAAWAAAAAGASLRDGEFLGTHSSCWPPCAWSKTTSTCVAVSIRTHALTPRTSTRSPTSRWTSVTTCCRGIWEGSEHKTPRREATTRRAVVMAAEGCYSQNGRGALRRRRGDIQRTVPCEAPRGPRRRGVSRDAHSEPCWRVVWSKVD